MNANPMLHRSVTLLIAVIVLVTCLRAPSWAGEDADRDSKATRPKIAEGKVTERPSSIALTPAVVMVKAKPGQTFSQELTLWNNTSQELAFQMEARDVVVRDGKRVFVPAGEVEGSIARYAVFSERNPIARPGASTTTTVTVTIPDSAGPRAIACIFMGKTIMGTRNAVAMTGSLGALVTFTMADDFRVQSQPLHVSVDADAQSITFRQSLTNAGSDPVVPKGVLAVTNENGSLVARLLLSGQRLLPGETMEFTAEHAGLLKSGKYHVVSLMENESAFFSNSAEFTIQ